MSRKTESTGACHLALADSTPHLLGPGLAQLPLPASDALMLAWLALEGPTPRERLAALLWPDKDPASARNALRQRLFRLRRLGGHPVVTGSLVLALHAEVGHDLMGASSILGTLRPRLGRELGAWLDAQRLQRQAGLWRALETRIDTLEASGDFAQALNLAQELLQAQPRSEAAHRRVIRLHYLRGDRGAALLAFDRCEDVLKHEVGASPSLETLELLAAIEQPDVVDRTPPRHGRLPLALLRPPRLVGREGAIAALRQAWAAGSHAFVLGVPGQGRSRLLEWLAAHEPGFVLAQLPGGAPAGPLAATRHVVQALWRRTKRAADDDLARRLAPLLGAHADGAADHDDPARWAGPLAELLEASGTRVLAVDDAHQADDASLALWQALAGHAPTCWCFSLRTGAPGSTAHGFASRVLAAGRSTMVPLRGLDEPALDELLDSLRLEGLQGLAGPNGESPASMLRRLAGGHPQLTLETLRVAWRNLDSPGAGSCWPEAASFASRATAQLACLSPLALELARLAALAGPRFSVALAAVVLQLNPLALADAWTEAQQAQVLDGAQPASLIVLEALRAGVPSALAEELRTRIALADVGP